MEEEEIQDEEQTEERTAELDYFEEFTQDDDSDWSLPDDDHDEFYSQFLLEDETKKDYLKQLRNFDPKFKRGHRELESAGVGVTRQVATERMQPNGSPDSLRDALALRESVGAGGYTAASKNSSAYGKYQFLKGTVQGLGRDWERYKKDPQYQEETMNQWEKEYLNPNTQKLGPLIRQQLGNVSDEQIKMMIHFAGAGNVMNAIKTGDFAKPLDANGTSILSYIR